MSQYPYTGPYSTTNQPGTHQTGTGTGLGTTGTGTGYTTTGYGTTTGVGTTGMGTTGLGTGIQTGYHSTDPHYIPSSTTGNLNLQQQPIAKRKHRPQSRSSSSSSSSDEEKRAKKAQKKGIGQKIKQIPAKVKEMVTGHHESTDTTGPARTQYP